MKSIIAVSILALLLSGCAEKFIELNAQIADSNAKKLTAYGAALAACGDNSGCQVGLTFAYASGAGQQQFVKPETGVDYLKAFMPYAALGTDWLRIFYGGSGGGQGITINRSSDFSISGSGNKQEAESGGVLTANVAPYSTDQRINFDTVSDGGGISGTSPPAETVVVQPEVVTVPAL